MSESQRPKLPEEEKQRSPVQPQQAMLEGVSVPDVMFERRERVRRQPVCVRYSGMAHFDTLIWPTWILIFCLILPDFGFAGPAGVKPGAPVFRGAV